MTDSKKCIQCGKSMNPVEAIMGSKNGVCGECVRKNHKEATR